MNQAVTVRSSLRPLPMRITQLQFDRLHAARERDGLSVQEHVRRALDLYLSIADGKSSEAADRMTPVTGNPNHSPLASRQRVRTR